MSEPRRILVVDDDRVFRLSTAELLRQDGYEVVLANDGSGAVQALGTGEFDLMLLDLRMPGIDGIDLVEVLRKRGQGIPVLMITGFGTIETAVRSMHTGVEDFLTKPIDPDVLSARVGEILDRHPGQSATMERIPGMVGRSTAMRQVSDAIVRVASTDSTVLITGETGTGKELVARGVHELSRRSGEPFIPVNCAALAEGLLESELFGHVKGAFTGAVRDRKGLFEAAAGGSVLLDEIGDMSLRLQQRLLRVLQEREVTPVGAAKPRAIDTRVVAATNRDLREEVAEGRFREDLFYRLNVFCIHIPPLRERREDIPLLIEAALERVVARMPGRVPTSCSPFAGRLLRKYDWPGNVRELLGVIEGAAIRAAGGRIEAQHLPPEIRQEGGNGASRIDSGQAKATPQDERAAIEAALAEAGGVRMRAAELLGVSRTTLWRKMKDMRM